jgi:hypothetical protein
MQRPIVKTKVATPIARAKYSLIVLTDQVLNAPTAPTIGVKPNLSNKFMRTTNQGTKFR